MRGLSLKRFLTRKAIKRHLRVNSVHGRKGNSLSDKMKFQPHRLYKGRNYQNQGGYAHNSKNLGLNRHDLRNYVRAQEMLKEFNE